MKLYKLTNENGYTKNRMHWEVGTTHEVSGKPSLCSHTVIHAYTSPLLAVLMNPVHASFINPKCFTADGDVLVDDGTKVGVQKLTITGTFELPLVSTNQRTAFGILCALEVHHKPDFVLWANRWLSGEDRSESSTAAYAAYAAADAALAADDAAAQIDFQALAEKALTYK